MGNGYTRVSVDPIDQLMAQITALKDQVKELQRPTGSQIYDTLATLTDLVNNLSAQIAAISASGQTWFGPVTTTGTVSADTGVSSTGVYNNLLTVSFRAMYVTSTGPFGYVPSSRRFKSDESPAPDIRSAVLALQLINFRYDQEIERVGDDAAIEWGLIAEDMHSLGLTWLVDYDDEGAPFGIKYERLSLALLPVIQDHENRLNAAGL